MAQPATQSMKSEPFITYRFHAWAPGEGAPIAGLAAAKARPRIKRPPAVSASCDEAAARLNLMHIFSQETLEPILALTAQERPQTVPDLRFLGARDLGPIKTRLVRFDQTHRSVPVFGSNVVVEMTSQREFLSLTAQVAPTPALNPFPKIGPEKALQQIANFTKGSFTHLQSTVAPPALRFFHDRGTNQLHLVYLFRRVPAAPEELLRQLARRKSLGHWTGPVPRASWLHINYMVDANTGDIVFYYSDDPMFAAPEAILPSPTRLQGQDEDGKLQTIDGRQVSNGFELTDPLRKLKTCDLNFHDVDPNNLPPDPVQSSTSQIQNKAAVSAHLNATRVWDFYNSILVRDSIDDKGMALVSVVNCTYSPDEPPPEWHNAVWAESCMWYGQTRDPSGNLRSYSRFLDVIAHELTHGVTKTTAGLVYRGESGALNESLSDIFGVIIRNWYLADKNSVADWSWEIGSGLGSGNGPLRDMSNPTRTDKPDNMNKYDRTTDDFGGVHTNSNIHNKAVYNVLTTTDDSGTWAFTPRDVAILILPRADAS